MTESNDSVLHEDPQVLLEEGVLVFPKVHVEAGQVEQIRVEQVATAAVVSAVGLICLL